MDTIADRHSRALAAATAVIAGLDGPQWERPSQCAGWSIRDLVRHMVGQNFGFAAALGEGDAPLGAYEPRDVEEWPASVDQLSQAVAAPAGEIRLAEVRPHLTLSPDVVVGMHLLDTVVHTWDICGPPWRPEPDVADAIVEQARRVPDSARRGDGPFRAVIPGLDEDPWHEALRLLGREPAPRSGMLRP